MCRNSSAWSSRPTALRATLRQDPPVPVRRARKSVSTRPAVLLRGSASRLPGCPALARRSRRPGPSRGVCVLLHEPASAEPPPRVQRGADLLAGAERASPYTTGHGGTGELLLRAACIENLAFVAAPSRAMPPTGSRTGAICRSTLGRHPDEATRGRRRPRRARSPLRHIASGCPPWASRPLTSHCRRPRPLTAGAAAKGSAHRADPGLLAMRWLTQQRRSQPAPSASNRRRTTSPQPRALLRKARRTNTRRAPNDGPGRRPAARHRELVRIERRDAALRRARRGHTPPAPLFELRARRITGGAPGLRSAPTDTPSPTYFVPRATAPAWRSSSSACP